jgi:hypothetical protein
MVEEESEQAPARFDAVEQHAVEKSLERGGLRTYVNCFGGRNWRRTNFYAISR